MVRTFKAFKSNRGSSVLALMVFGVLLSLASINSLKTFSNFFKTSRSLANMGESIDLLNGIRTVLNTSSLCKCNFQNLQFDKSNAQAQIPLSRLNIYTPACVAGQTVAQPEAATNDNANRLRVSNLYLKNLVVTDATHATASLHLDYQKPKAINASSKDFDNLSFTTTTSGNAVTLTDCTPIVNGGAVAGGLGSSLTGGTFTLPGGNCGANGVWVNTATQNPANIVVLPSAGTYLITFNVFGHVCYETAEGGCTELGVVSRDTGWGNAQLQSILYDATLGSYIPSSKVMIVHARSGFQESTGSATFLYSVTAPTTLHPYINGGLTAYSSDPQFATPVFYFCGTGSAVSTAGTQANTTLTYLKVNDSTNSGLAASIKINGVTDAIASANGSINTPITWTWTSSNAYSASSVYWATETNSCNVPTTPIPWIANSTNGTTSQSVPCGVYKKFYVTFTVYGSNGQSTSSTASLTMIP